MSDVLTFLSVRKQMSKALTREAFFVSSFIMFKMPFLLYIKSGRKFVHSLYPLKDYVMKFLFLLAIDYFTVVGFVS